MKKEDFKGCFCAKEKMFLDENKREDTQKVINKNCHSRLQASGMTSLFNNGLISRGFTQRRHAELVSASSRFKSGFTLIELLVVVLIIGILSAVALPQYNKAVNKSRLATLVSKAESLVESVQVYYLTNGDWPSYFSQLDVALPANMSSSVLPNGPTQCKYNHDFYCCIVSPSEAGIVAGSITCGVADEAFGYTISYAEMSGAMRVPNIRICWQKPGMGVCETLSGKYERTTGTNKPTPTGWKSGYDNYKFL